MRTALANLRKTQRKENGNDIIRFENGDVSHRLRHCNILDTDKFRLQVWLTIFEKHGNDFLEITVKFVESFALRVGTGKARDKSHKKLGLGATFNYGRVGSHDWLRHRE